MAQRQIPLATKATRLDYLREDIDLWSWGDLSAKEMATLTVRPLRILLDLFLVRFLTIFLVAYGRRLRHRNLRRFCFHART